MYDPSQKFSPVNNMERCYHVADSHRAGASAASKTEKPRWTGLFMWLGAPILESSHG
jgi:hypothetical protein